jgi:hypothetical protein
MNSDNRLPLVLFLLRLSVFIVMFMWTLDKLLNPKHAAAVYKNFYFIGGIENIIFLIGAQVFYWDIRKNGRTVLSLYFMQFRHWHHSSNISHHSQARIFCFLQHGP